MLRIRFFEKYFLNKINLELAKKYWVKDYSNFEPKDTNQGHWGSGQTGFNISKNGKIFLSDNKKIKDEFGEWVYPNHRDLIVGFGDDETVYSGIYSWGYGAIEFYLYPDAERILNFEMKKGLASLIGVHKITSETAVYSNTSRKLLFFLGDVLKNSN